MEAKLRHAAWAGNLEAVKQLIAEGENINSQDQYGGTALIEAVQKRHTEIVTFLLSHGVDVHLRDSHGKNALDYAIQDEGTRSSLEMVRLLLEHGATVDKDGDRGRRLLKYTLRSHQPELAALLRQYGAVYIHANYTCEEVDQLIEKLAAGEEVLCKACQTPILFHSAGLYCQDGCTEIEIYTGSGKSFRE